MKLTLLNNNIRVTNLVLLVWSQTLLTTE